MLVRTWINQFRVTVPTPPFKVWGKKFEYDPNIKKKLFSNRLLAWKFGSSVLNCGCRNGLCPMTIWRIQKNWCLVPVIDSASSRECNTKSDGGFNNLVIDCHCQQGIKFTNFLLTRKERDHYRYCLLSEFFSWFSNMVEMGGTSTDCKWCCW